LSTLAAMLERHGPTGGLDSFVEEIKAPLTHFLCAPLLWPPCAYMACTRVRARSS